MKFLKKKTKLPTVKPPTPIIGTAGSLREFVYLDEVSVYSLTSSPDLPPPTSMSESQESIAGEGISAQIEAGSPLLAAARVNADLNSSQTDGLHVQRQFNIQSQFARLHSMYRPIFLLTANKIDTKHKATTTLEEALEQLQTTQQAIRAEDLTRGALAELRVSLRAHHTFDVASFTRLVTGLIKRYPELLQVKDVSGMQAAMEGGEFLTELLDNLVPIEGESTTHGIVTTSSGRLWVANLEALDSVWGGESDVKPLRVVGVAEVGTFWKDTRRILYADAEFDVLGRIARTGLQDQWTPVKMIDTFKRVVPSAADALIAAVDGLKSIDHADLSVNTVESALLEARTKFASKLAEFHQVEAVRLASSTLSPRFDDDSLESKLAYLSAAADEFYATHSELERDEDTVGLLRQDVWRNLQEQLTETPYASSSEPVDQETSILELEFIAMYW